MPGTSATGEALPRVSGKYLPSQLRTQNAGPELPAATSGAAGRGLLVVAEGIGEETRLRRGLLLLLFLEAAEKKSNRPSADATRGADTTVPASTTAATSIMRRRMR